MSPLLDQRELTPPGVRLHATALVRLERMVDPREVIAPHKQQ